MEGTQEVKPGQDEWFKFNREGTQEVKPGQDKWFKLKFDNHLFLGMS